jgi:ribonuclease HII
MLLELDQAYPQYGLAKHKGYPTKEHREAVRKYGVAPIYRKTFLRFLQKEEQ